jgi:hypothetical protein
MDLKLPLCGICFFLWGCNCGTSGLGLGGILVLAKEMI